MEKQYNLYNLEPLFEKYLLTENISPISLKNYLSDFRHFVGWLTFYVRLNQIKAETVDELSLQIQSKTICEYRAYLTTNNIPHKTINRRLSTVRKFCSFCISQGWMKKNPAKQILNIKPACRQAGIKKSNLNIINQFQSDLEKQGLDQTVITSCLEDIRDFLSI